MAWGPWYFRNFRPILPPNIGEDQAYVLPSERRAPGTVPYIKKVRRGLTLQVSGRKPLI